MKEDPIEIGELLEDIESSDNPMRSVMNFEHDNDVRFTVSEKAQLFRWARCFIEVERIVVLIIFSLWFTLISI